MDIRGNQVSLTGSEAEYVMGAAIYGRRYALAQRILEIRVARVRERLGEDALPESIPLLNPNVSPADSSVQKALFLGRLLVAEGNSGQDESGAESHAIHTTMSQEELDWLRDGAVHYAQMTRDDLMIPEGAHGASLEETGDFHSPDAARHAGYFQDSLAELGIAAGIAQAIDAARGAPPA